MPPSGTDLASVLLVAVDALIDRRPALPPPAERRRLRIAHGLGSDEVGQALNVSRETVERWEAGREEPGPPQREAYARLLDRLAALYPPPAVSTSRGGTPVGSGQTVDAVPRPAAPPHTEREPVVHGVPRVAAGLADVPPPARVPSSYEFTGDGWRPVFTDGQREDGGRGAGASAGDGTGACSAPFCPARR